MFNRIPKRHMVYEFLRGLKYEVFCYNVTENDIEEYFVFLDNGTEEEIDELLGHFVNKGYPPNSASPHLVASLFAGLPVKPCQHFGVGGKTVITFVTPNEQQLMLTFVRNCDLTLAVMKKLSDDSRRLAYELAKDRYSVVNLKDLEVNAN